MAENITPEEKLLRLIENPGSDLKAAKQPLRIPNLFSLKKIKAAIMESGALKENFKLRLFNLKFINRALMAASLIITAYLVSDFVNGRPNLLRIDAYALDMSGRAPQAEIQREGKVLNLSDYLSQVDKRDVFHFIPVKKEEKPPAAKEALNTAASNLKLVGIIWSKNPQAMIEDKKENKTLLVNPGEAIGQIKVKQILKDKVIIGYEDQEMELM